MVAVAVLLQLLILAGALYDTAGLLTSTRSRPSLRPRLRRAVLEEAERRLVRQRLHGQVDAAVYRERMRSLADGRHRPRTRHHS